MTPSDKPWPRWRGYLLAVVLTVVAVVFRWLAQPWLGNRPFVLVFLLPVILAAYFSGLRAGLLATALIAIATGLWVFPPRGSLLFENELDFAHWLFLILMSVLISVLFDQHWRHHVEERAAQKRTTTERKVRAAFGGALGLLGIIGIVSFLSVVRLDANAAELAHAHAIVNNLERLLTAANASEAAQRGFLVTGDESFVASYREAASEMNFLVDEVARDLPNDAADNARIAALRAAVAARLARSNEVIQQRRNVGLDEMMRHIRSYQGVQLQTALRSRVADIRVPQLDLLSAHTDAARDGARLAETVIVGGSVFALMFVGLALYAIRRDFAGRERAEAELARFFDLSPDLFVIASGDGYFKRMSSAVTEILGYSVEEALEIGYMDMMHPDDRPRAHEAVTQQMTEGRRIDRFDARFRHKDGSYRILSWRSMPRGDLMFGTARDITESSRAEAELREAKQMLESRVAERTRALAEANASLQKSERRFRALIENGADSIALIDADNRILYLSPAVLHVEGYRPEELLGHNGAEHTHPDDWPAIQRTVEQLVAHPGKPIPVLWRRRHKDGRWIWLEGVATNLLDDPSVGAIVTNYRDVTERLAAEAKLREQLQRLALLSRVTRAIGERQDLESIFQVVVRTIEDELPVDFCCICLYDMGEHRLSVSSIGERSVKTAVEIGLEPQSIVPIDENGLGRCVRGHLVYEADIAGSAFDFPRKLAAAGMRSLVIAPMLVESQVFGVLITARRAPDAYTSSECEFLRQASEHTALASHQAQLYGALQQAYDDLRTSQQQIMQQERLRALGQMASGIAHDINNAISPVALYTESLLEREVLSPRARNQLEIIQRAVDDVAQTVARMGEFYRLREPQVALVPVDLNKLVKQVIALTRARWSDMAQQRGAAIEVRTELLDDLPPVAAVESQIRDALVNLIFNAVDAMPTGGPLTIRTSVTGGAGSRIVHLEVIDAGVGMSEETRRRCLEPFFTTKGTRGTGLGLAMVYGVAQRHGANLEIESEVGQGTLVRLSFAVAPATAASTAHVQPAPDVSLRILIIDDDPLLLKSLRDTLESDGHQVTSASGGQAGINAFVESHAAGTPFPIVITDLGMPHVDGRKVASTIKASVPTTLVIMLTGWGRRLVAEGDQPPGVDQVLSKPPKLMELRAALAKASASRA